MIKNTLLTIAIIISIFGYMDYKSNQFSRKMLLLKSQREYEQAILNGKRVYKVSAHTHGTSNGFMKISKIS